MKFDITLIVIVVSYLSYLSGILAIQNCGPRDDLFCRQLNCPYGKRWDLSKCPHCSCNACPSLRNCPLTCNPRLGHVKDANGCDTCKCKCGPLCEWYGFAVCPPHGFKIEKDGCEVCQCSDVPTWGQWTSYSQCSVTCEGVGLKTRTRECLLNPKICPGGDTDRVQCNSSHVTCPTTASPIITTRRRPIDDCPNRLLASGNLCSSDRDCGLGGKCCQLQDGSGQSFCSNGFL